MVISLWIKQQTYMKISHCTGCTALTVQWHKAIMQILKVLSKHLQGKPGKSPEF